MKKTLPYLFLVGALLLLFSNCRQKETASPQKFVPQTAADLVIDSVTNYHEDTTYHYEYRTGTSGNYQYNYDVRYTDSDSTELEGNINVQGKFGKGTLTNANQTKFDVTTEWTGYGKLLATDADGNQYEISVK